jgi:hypothetical protein
MFDLIEFLRKAPSVPHKEEPKIEAPPVRDGLIIDIHKKVNKQEPFSLVYIDVIRKNGKVIGDTNYICELVGGKLITSRNIGVIVPFGAAELVYNKLEQLAEAPFHTELRLSHVSYTGHSEEHKDIVHDLLVEAQMYKTRRTYIGKNPPQSLGEKLLECA